MSYTHSSLLARKQVIIYWYLNVTMAKSSFLRNNFLVRMLYTDVYWHFSSCTLLFDVHVPSLRLTKMTFNKETGWLAGWLAGWLVDRSLILVVLTTTVIIDRLIDRLIDIHLNVFHSVRWVRLSMMLMYRGFSCWRWLRSYGQDAVSNVC